MICSVIFIGVFIQDIDIRAFITEFEFWLYFLPTVYLKEIT